MRLSFLSRIIFLQYKADSFCQTVQALIPSNVIGGVHIIFAVSLLKLRVLFFYSVVIKLSACGKIALGRFSFRTIKFIHTLVCEQLRNKEFTVSRSQFSEQVAAVGIPKQGNVGMYG